jgi:glutathione S-transferase
MFKLYYKTGACSLSPHIVLREAGLLFELVKVDTRIGRTQDGADFRLVNPRGYVPALQNEEGRVLTEGPAIVQYLADLVPSKQLAPPNGTWERTRLQEWLNYLSTELHKGISPLFSPIAPDAWKHAVRDQYEGKLSWLDGQLAKGGPFLMGESYSVADPYLFTILGWLRVVGIDLARWPALADFRARMLQRPAVRAAMDAEGLKH